jgi:flagellar biosynthesis/type III secretory pathway protein FliH
MHRHTILLKEHLRSVARAAPGEVSAPKPRAEEPPVVEAATDTVAIQGLHQAIAEFLASLHSQRAGLASEIAQASVELAVQIAERLLGNELAANRQRLDQIVLSSLERIQASRAIVIKANPLDLQLLQQQLTENTVPDHYKELLNFQRDDSCPRGRLKLETDELFIEWDTQRSLTEIRGVLLEEIYSEAAVQ